MKVFVNSLPKNLSELVTNNIEEYEDLAIKLCNDKSKYLSVKKKISKNVKSTSLFNSESYLAIYRR